MEKFGVIYRIRNRRTNKCYIGQTTLFDPDVRIRRHFQASNKTNQPLWNSIKKNGKDEFDVDILVTAFNIEGLNELEIKLIEENKAMVPDGYNIKMGGSQGGKCTEETKVLISQRLKEYYKKNGHPYKGRKFTKEHCDNLSKVRKGFTSEARMKVAKINGERLAQKVKAIHIETGKETIFKSLSECAEKLGLQGCNISRVLNKRQNRTQHKGYKFERLE